MHVSHDSKLSSFSLSTARTIDIRDLRLFSIQIWIRISIFKYEILEINSSIYFVFNSKRVVVGSSSSSFYELASLQLWLDPFLNKLDEKKDF